MEFKANVASTGSSNDLLGEEMSTIHSPDYSQNEALHTSNISATVTRGNENATLINSKAPDCTSQSTTNDSECNLKASSKLDGNSHDASAIENSTASRPALVSNHQTEDLTSSQINNEPLKTEDQDSMSIEYDLSGALVDEVLDEPLLLPKIEDSTTQGSSHSLNLMPLTYLSLKVNEEPFEKRSAGDTEGENCSTSSQDWNHGRTTIIEENWCKQGQDKGLENVYQGQLVSQRVREIEKKLFSIPDPGHVNLRETVHPSRDDSISLSMDYTDSNQSDFQDDRFDTEMQSDDGQVRPDNSPILSEKQEFDNLKKNCEGQFHNEPSHDKSDDTPAKKHEVGFFNMIEGFFSKACIGQNIDLTCKFEAECWIEGGMDFDMIKSKQIVKTHQKIVCTSGFQVLKDSAVAVWVFSSGKILIGGADSFADVVSAINQAVQSLGSMTNQTLKVGDAKLTGVIGTFDMGFGIDLCGLHYLFPVLSSYDASYGPVLRFEMSDPKVNAFVYKDGKVVVTGTKSESDMAVAHKKLTSFLYQFRRENI